VGAVPLCSRYRCACAVGLAHARLPFAFRYAFPAQHLHALHHLFGRTYCFAGAYLCRLLSRLRLPMPAPFFYYLFLSTVSFGIVAIGRRVFTGMARR
jgi:hypothetical protein